MGEWKLYGDQPHSHDAEFYQDREPAHHIEQGEHAMRLLISLALAEYAMMFYGVRSIADWGCGDGGLLDLAVERFGMYTSADGMPAHGYDLAPNNVKYAQRVRCLDVELLDFVNNFDQARGAGLIVCTEVLEHLPDPHGFLRRVAAEGKTSFMVVSSPMNERPGSAYEHHLWAWDEEGYRALIENNGWRVLNAMHAWPSQIYLIGVN